MENEKFYRPNIGMYDYDIYKKPSTAKSLATKHSKNRTPTVVEYELVKTGRILQKIGGIWKERLPNEK
jgi:hypothetical protein